jgi:hypothetical protein
VKENIAVSVMEFNSESERYVPWSGKPFGLPDVFYSDVNGQFSALLPPGKYVLVIKESGYNHVVSTAFTLHDTQFVMTDFIVTPATGLRGLLQGVIDHLKP